MEDRTKIVAKFATEIVEIFVAFVRCSKLDASILLQGGDMGSERLWKGYEGAVLKPPGIVVDREEDADVVGGVGHPGMPEMVSYSSKGSYQDNISRNRELRELYLGEIGIRASRDSP